MAEVIKVDGKNVYIQVFESTRGLKVGMEVDFQGHMLEAMLGPGLLEKSWTDFRTTSTKWTVFS